MAVGERGVKSVRYIYDDIYFMFDAGRVVVCTSVCVCLIADGEFPFCWQH